MPTYRVWVHPKRGSDYFYTFTSLSKASQFSRKADNREPPLLVKGRTMLKQMEYPISKEKIQKALKRKPVRREELDLFNPKRWW